MPTQKNLREDPLRSKNRPSAISAVCFSLLAWLAPALGNPYAGYPSPQAQPPAWPYAPPGRHQPAYPPQTLTLAPRLASELSQERAYVQQAVILKLSLVSRNNLLTAVPQLPESDRFTLRWLEGPNTYARTHNGQQEIVNDFFYELIPLRAGPLELPKLRVTGEAQRASGDGRGGGAPFEAISEAPLRLEISDADPRSSPWLPLEALNLKVNLPGGIKPTAGKPLPLTVELDAVGLGGGRLPSLEPQLKSEAFRVYREQSEVTTSFDRGNHRIHGRRIERFTLVPQYGGDLKLPQLRVNWWNTRSDMPQRTSLPLQPIAVTGSLKPGGRFAGESGGGPFLSGTSSAFWIPLAVVFGVIFGYWLAFWIAHRGRKRERTSPLQPLVSFLQRPMRQMAPAFSPLKSRLQQTGRLLNPVARWHRWRRRLVAGLPLPVRFWFCVRFVDEEKDPEVWGFTLRFLANKHLGLPLNAPFSIIGRHILDFHPKADPLKIHDLIHQLEESVYGHRELDFEGWKAAFKHEIRPSLKLWPRPSDGKSHRKPLLPGLNPGNAAM